MLNQFSRTELLLGKEAMERLSRARVAVFGVGGVGGYTAEALVRSGVGAIDVIDDDKVCLTNLNRQIIATRSSVGRYKVDVMKERILDINPACAVEAYQCFYLPETQEQFDFRQYDYVVDAVDTVTAKLALVMQAKEMGTPIKTRIKKTPNSVSAIALSMSCSFFCMFHGFQAVTDKTQCVKHHHDAGEGQDQIHVAHGDLHRG